MADREHDEELNIRLAETTEGNAHYHDAHAQEEERSDEELPSRWSQHRMLAASGFAIAASYWSLVNPRKAVELYRLAARKYRELGHSYWMPLALASVDVTQVRSMAEVLERMPSPSPTAVAFTIIGNSMGGQRNSEQVESLWQHIGNVPVGRLGIPMDMYGLCARAMTDAFREKNFERFRAAATGYLQRAAEVLRAASHDRYHWAMLQSEILPAEPEAVAMGIAMSIVSRSVFRMPMTEFSADLDRHGRVIVEVADNMHTAAGSEPTPRATAR
jgi:hypothetical protein